MCHELWIEGDQAATVSPFLSIACDAPSVRTIVTIGVPFPGLPAGVFGCCSPGKVRHLIHPRSTTSDYISRRGLFSVLRGLLAHGAAEEFGQRGVEGGAGLLLDLLQGFVDGEGCSFRFFGGQFVKHLGNADNASEQGRAFFS